MTVAIVDDSVNDIELLYSYISRYCHERHVQMTIEKFTSGTAFLESIPDTVYNLVFLDIYMEHTTGIHVAKRIQELNPKCQIIFTTISEEHAVMAFRLHILDYLVKPYEYTCLEDALDNYELAASRFAHYIELKEGRYYTRVLVSDIMYTDYSNHYIQVHTTSCVIRSYMSFDNFYPMLSPYPNFLWCYRNCMVNMDFIESYLDRDFILKNGECIPISAARRQEILQAYSDYVFDHYSKGGFLP